MTAAENGTGAHVPVGSDLSRRLRELRTARTLTQKQLAELFAVSAALVSSWEKAVAVPPLHRLQQYVLIFDGDAAMLDELLALATDSGARAEIPSESLLDVMKDIRWLLVQIKERLPPPPER